MVEYTLEPHVDISRTHHYDVKVGIVSEAFPFFGKTDPPCSRQTEIHHHLLKLFVKGGIVFINMTLNFQGETLHSSFDLIWLE
jgi:hypothetical protein